MNVLMMPNPLEADNLPPSGITTVLRDYARYAPEYGINFVDENSDSIDVVAVHAGMSLFYTDLPYVAHCHGLYWTGDYSASAWEFRANRDVITSLRRATITTVPSHWVAATLNRDMHLDPMVLPHGIDASLWKPNPIERKYILWNKNRSGDVCDPTAVRELAMRFPAYHFLSTFAPANSPPNVLVTGSLAHSEMREVVQSAHIYLSTTKETFGIGLLEARASGVPILAYDEGGASSIVRHGIDGYLARPGDIEDLAKGLHYCMRYRDDLSANALVHADEHSWPFAMEQLVTIYNRAMILHNSLAKGVTVVIPCHNYGHTLERAVHSAFMQNYPAEKVIVVDDGSTDDTPRVMDLLLPLYEGKIQYIRTENKGVAHARNRGMMEVRTKYACCLDADDEIGPDFLSVCVRSLNLHPDCAIAYTKITVVDAEGNRSLSEWPGSYNYDRFLMRQNQVPTCCVFRTDIFRRAGGYRQRYAPTGAGSEDANLWLRMGALGYGGILASDQGHFYYHLGGRVSGDRSYREVDWLSPYAWTITGIHPFASVASSNNVSHEVYQYDMAKITVVIPCGPGHIDSIVDAIDSVEGQSYRYWRLIVVFDGVADNEAIERLRVSYPFVTFIISDNEPQGAGWARNRGAAAVKTPYLLFLDADDWLDMKCLDTLYREMQRNGDSIIYSDYIGHAQMDETEARKLEKGKRLMDYEPKTQMATVRHFAADYDCALAQQQPILEGNGSFYIWNIITSLMPTKWHNEIGGFDEQMVSWEDWDYWIRLAQLGKCFRRVEEPLVHYRFYTGERREIGRQRYDDLLDYMLNKYEGTENMPCSGCKGRTAKVRNSGIQQPMMVQNGAMMMASADDMVTVELIDGNIAKHPISFRDGRDIVKYGYRAHGEQFLVRRDHAELHKKKFRIVDTGSSNLAVTADTVDTEELSAPTPLKVFTSSEADKARAEVERNDIVNKKTSPPSRTAPKKTAPKRRSA